MMTVEYPRGRALDAIDDFLLLEAEPEGCVRMLKILLGIFLPFSFREAFPWRLFLGVTFFNIVSNSDAA